ncbi:MAG: heavy-metal-associated domain-containing protein [Crocinitomicaceae bacterium]|jgi:copper chaperone CopZ|nr:heavy-metal-associated domain-containing protein [Crocinitomicaceae bacterium]
MKRSKNRKMVILAMGLVLFSSCAVFKGGQNETAEIKTNAECGMCKDKIEGELNYVKGIRFAELDVDSKVLTVKFNTNKIDSATIKKKISEIGYSADEVPADPTAQQKLPDCCQPGGMSK